MRRIITRNMAQFCTTIAKNHYEVLGVPKEASEDDIKSAYYKLAKQYHPDIHPQFAQKFKQVNLAYNMLKDPVKRVDYDNLQGRAANKENVQQASKSFYNTHFHYGYTDKFKKQTQKKYNYESNPFATNYEKSFSNEFTRNMFKKENDGLRKNNLKKMNGSVRNALIVIFSFMAILFLTEIMLDLYKFNHEKQKTVYGRPKDVY